MVACDCCSRCSAGRSPTASPLSSRARVASIALACTSKAYTLPPAPTARARHSVSWPLPQVASTTVSPGRHTCCHSSCAMCVSRACCINRSKDGGCSCCCDALSSCKSGAAPAAAAAPGPCTPLPSCRDQLRLLPPAWRHHKLLSSALSLPSRRLHLWCACGISDDMVKATWLQQLLIMQVAYDQVPMPHCPRAPKTWSRLPPVPL